MTIIKNYIKPVVVVLINNEKIKGYVDGYPETIDKTFIKIYKDEELLKPIFLSIHNTMYIEINKR